jgi:hypothetical protein
VNTRRRLDDRSARTTLIERNFKVFSIGHQFVVHRDPS